MTTNNISREEKLIAYEEVKHRIATWRWSHDAAWLRLVTKYVEMRTALGKSNDLMVFGSHMDGGYEFSDIGCHIMSNWLGQEA